MLTGGIHVLLPVVSPASVPHLALVALGLAGPQGTITALSVVTSEADDVGTRAATDLLDDVEEVVADAGIDLRTMVVFAESEAAAVHEAVGSGGVDVVVMGWAGSGSAQSAFGAIVDQVVGRSRVPLLMVRPGAALPSSLLLVFDTDQLHPSGRRGLKLAAEVARTLQERNDWPLTLLQTGAETGPDLPRVVAELSDRLHHDPRRRHVALEATTHAELLVVAPVAPTVAGLRSATARINWAAGDATLAVAVDVGPVGDTADLRAAASVPLRAVPSSEPPSPRQFGIAVTVAAEEPPDRHAVQRALRDVGPVTSVRTWRSAEQFGACLGLTVVATAGTESAAIGRVLEVLDALPALAGARVRYEPVAAPTPWRVRELTPLGLPDLFE